MKYRGTRISSVSGRSLRSTMMSSKLTYSHGKGSSRAGGGLRMSGLGGFHFTSACCGQAKHRSREIGMWASETRSLYCAKVLTVVRSVFVMDMEYGYGKCGLYL